MVVFKLFRGIIKYDRAIEDDSVQQSTMIMPYYHRGYLMTSNYKWYWGEGAGGRELPFQDHIEVFRGNMYDFFRDIRTPAVPEIYDICTFEEGRVVNVYHSWDILPRFNDDLMLEIRYVL
jgi:hypothetical protein